jgi:Ca2+-binding RTX toxin-like protein
MSHTQNRRARRALLAAAIATVAIPAAAQASTATLEGTTLNISAAAGERNAVAVNDSGSAYSVRDAAGIRARTGCTQVSPVEARCGGVGVNVLLGDLSDSFVAGTNRAITVDAGVGDDSYVQNAIDGFTRVDFRGGAGFDTASYVNADRGVIVTKDQVANDGRIASGITSLDRDNVRNDVEKLVGSRFNDSLNGHNLAAPEQFDGLLGDDALTGHSGSDTFLAGSTDDGSDRINGGAGEDAVDYVNRSANLRVTIDSGSADDGQAGEGDDVRAVEGLRGGRGDDFLEAIAGSTARVHLNGLAGNDTLRGGAGPDDILTGSGTRDFVFGQAGSDQIIVDDGGSDVIDCGAGSDRVLRSVNEGSLRDCEADGVLGKLSLSPENARAQAGEPVRMQLSWRHPRAWQKLRTISFRLRLEGAEVGELTIRPRARTIASDGAVTLARKAKLVAKGRTVSVKLALNVDSSLAGKTLRAEVEATDNRGRRQVERRAGTVRVAG